MIRTRPLMGRTYSRLGATLGSPKLRLLSLLSLLSRLSPVSPPLQSERSSLNLFPFSHALLCAASLVTTKRLCPIHIISPPCLLGPKGAASLTGNDLVVPVCPHLNNTCNSRRTLA